MYCVAKPGSSSLARTRSRSSPDGLWRLKPHSLVKSGKEGGLKSNLAASLVTGFHTKKTQPVTATQQGADLRVLGPMETWSRRTSSSRKYA
ncbi:hypothetical protein ZWY2020_028198 [Hordeum vulgare]|nr:hypothetical protein ZWY2020_028198 [Hordeum vulgare]